MGNYVRGHRARPAADGDGGHPEQATAEPRAKKRVLLVGVCGPSCSGKSTLSKTLAERLDSPFMPIHLDGYFAPERMPTDPKWGLNWETPEGLNFSSLVEDLERLLATLAQAAEVPENLSLQANENRGGGEVREGHAGRRLRAEQPVVVVVEGFLLFFEQVLTGMFDATLWLDAECDVCCRRRHQREGGGADYAAFEEWYTSVCWSHFLVYKDVQLKNAPQALRLDAHAPADELVDKALAHCCGQLSLEEVAQVAQAQGIRGLMSGRRGWLLECWGGLRTLARVLHGTVPARPPADAQAAAQLTTRVSAIGSAGGR